MCCEDFCCYIECDKNKTCCENCKICCKQIKLKRYFLPLVFGPVALIYEDFQNYVYIPVFMGLAAFFLFWNFPWIVYYTASKPLYYEDLFIDEKKLPNYEVSPRLKNKFQMILIWVLIASNSLLVAALGDYWLYRAKGIDATFEILGVTGGIIKIFQILPLGYACMPCTVAGFNMLINLAVLINCIMGTDLRLGIAQPLQRVPSRFHASIMNND